MQVTKDKVVTIEYTMTDEEGTVVDTTDNGEPLSFIQGKESLLAAIEAAIEGRDVGEKLSIVLEPEQAYGHRDKSLIRKVPRSHVNVSGDLEVGLKLRGRNGSNVTPITVVEFDDETVTLDANNPLAGATLGVELVIVEVRDAIDEELKSGRVQDMEAIYEKERVDGVVVEFKL
ncbi:FKBP-type peptidyl-prolyl cis-trans isomerase [Candidatus Endoriftia persephone]|jgi:FKBP-type peptidyl-prolyl cis-trans isomerase SlyD|uniref:Peptidyl-prolyl cis-trans isomerase n=3 Tax=Gammaproteobacteria TaxID=1236 RepID=G2FE10_9GAMM|nr:peptidylprolyl isomerase [Candidatus Endoriftia persephone]EGV52358.1 FKBP-type peptidyl-prolyl cis-trans isomerase SlyD [endosymbiont of Riftia pachyptila (vent Ph05)]EGW54994.1 FKBP-type peptidyl-prolyl cis-trans isomerase SlyD [endosymbiont of Tevnia jerichonana (vent Tica)]USF87853.1 peptidylprolyl isomerase [Candidatus Endoriftia persephone]